MNYKWVVDENQDYQINNVNHKLIDGEVTLTWDWPSNVEFVYIERFDSEEEIPFADKDIKTMKLVSIKEYRNQLRHILRVNTLGSEFIRVYAMYKENEEICIVQQANADNTIQIKASKGKIKYSITYSGWFFSSRKKVHITMDSEVAASHQALCYVKSNVMSITSKEDGIIYPLVRDVRPGRNEFPVFEVDKNEYVAVFLTDVQFHNNRYQLIPIS
jgi:hypothetical protein